MTYRYGVFSENERIAIAYVQWEANVQWGVDGPEKFTVGILPLSHSRGSFIPHANSEFFPFTDSTPQLQAVHEAVARVLCDPQSLEALVVRKL
ncbi:hypothetical protein RF679_07080 [Undibacterium cyanobacteriorum]|uniref:Uncharacterized protein n=1 Tax=Undibacterium cyanobacteriorum TaxID=3073561 RepID=A0ABY9RLE3_9BURK|nr:hypothetical protein [Undibacterium sp. 20NA77.5]WMW82042.1 hypothetical protein RF679_07080 [Undibacterium sp. 20NA77.5]